MAFPRTPRRRRDRRSLKTLDPSYVPPTPPPPTGNRILSVARVEAESPTLAVTLSQPALDVMVPGGFAVIMGSPVPADNVDLSDPLVVRFIFLEPIDAATQWLILDPSAWTFVDSEPLEEPFSGEVG